MIIVGSGSAGKETSGIIMLQSDEEIFFFDNNPKENLIYGKYHVISNIKKIIEIIKKDNKFCVAIGHPRIRARMFNFMLEIGAKPANVVSYKSFILSSIYENATIIQPGVCISYDVKIGKSNMIHANSTIGHKVEIGDFVNISPLCSIIGPTKIDDFTYIGTGSIVNPGLYIGKYSYITPGSIVKRDVKDYETYEN
jgi:sugar O-acyltransferase (sialic acid O-acetyltransferase NeuD family)